MCIISRIVSCVFDPNKYTYIHRHIVRLIKLPHLGVLVDHHPAHDIPYFGDLLSTMAYLGDC